MNTLHKLSLVVCATTMLSSLLFANAPQIKPAVAPHYGTYHLDTGFEATGPPSYIGRSGPETLFSNKQASYYFVSPPAQAELIDDAAFAQRGVLPNAEVNGIEFSYCSSELGYFDAILRFYQDINCSTGPSMNPSCEYSLTSIPGDTFGFGVMCWNLTVDLSGGLECTLPQELTAGGQEAIGVSVVYLDSSNTSGPIFCRANTAYGATDCYWDAALGIGTTISLPNVVGSFVITLYGNAMDSRTLHPRTPLAGDNLSLTVSDPVKGGSVVTFAAEGTVPGSSYSLLAASTPTSTYPSLGGGVATLLLTPPILTPTPLPMMVSGTTASLTAALPPALPPLIVTQVVGFVGPLSPANVTQASNALEHH